MSLLNIVGGALALLNLGAAIFLSDVVSTRLGLWDAKHVGTLVDVVGTAEEDIDLLERDLLGLGDEEIHKDSQDEVHSHEEEQTFQSSVCEELGEELLENL